jgi:transposase
MTDKKKHIDVSIIQAYVEGSISLKQASVMLERTPRTVMRIAAKYRDFGADGLIHGNTGKEPHNKIDSSIRQKILEAMSRKSLRLMPYNLAVRYLRYEGLEISAETLRRLLKEDPVLQQERKTSLHPLR